MDLAGRVYLDEARHSVITARIENLFDEEYATALGNSQLDSDGSDYTFWFPRCAAHLLVAVFLPVLTAILAGYGIR